MKHIKLFEQFVNEAVENFAVRVYSKYSKAKGLYSNMEQYQLTPDEMKKALSIFQVKDSSEEIFGDYTQFKKFNSLFDDNKFSEYTTRDLQATWSIEPWDTDADNHIGRNWKEVYIYID